MDLKEMTNKLAQSASSIRGKYIPWWEDNFEECMYKYDIFSNEEIKQIEECADACDINTLSDPAAVYGGNGYTLIHLLVWHNFYKPVKKALENGANANITDNRDKKVTPLMLACCRGNLEMVKLLLAHGANSAFCDANGKNSYHYLASARIESFVQNVRNNMALQQREDIAHLLGEGINQKDNNGMKPIDCMLHNNNASLSFILIAPFIEKGADIDYIDDKGNTLLITAILNGHITAALKLMEFKELVNKENNEGNTPMSIATNYHREGLCIALKDYGASQPCDIIQTNLNHLSQLTSNSYASFSEDNMDPITLAYYLTKKLLKQIDTDDDDDMKCIEGIFHNALVNDDKCYFLDLLNEAGIDFTALIHTGGSADCLRDRCLSGYKINVIKKFIELGVDVNEAIVGGRTPANIVASLEERRMFGSQKETYFEDAAEFFSVESMEQLDSKGTSAVHWAAKRGHVEMLKVMIEKGANVNLTEDDPAESGNTPLCEACIYGKSEIVKLLMASGADDSIQNVNGETPAHHAVMKKKFGGDLNSNERAGVLKELKNLDTARNDGKTPLMLLQYLDLNTTAELLPIFLDGGVNVNAADNNGNTALIINAQEQCYKNVIKELVRAGADVNAADKNGNTALYYSLKYGNQDVARFLVKKGADYNRSNNNGISPVQVAVEKGYDTVLELMTDIH